MNLIKLNFLKSIVGAAAIAAPMVGLTSCDNVIYEDLDPCVSGIEVRFIYDYNMLPGNAFPARVDCLTLFVYDNDYKYVTTLTETTDALADEGYRMLLDVAPGDYHLLAYGGMQCDEASFHFNAIPSEGSLMQSIGVDMNRDCLGVDPGRDLHGLYYGSLDVTVPKPSATTYSTVTLPMMCDTHNVRILLQHVNGNPVNYADFDFAITGADNASFDWKNDIIASGRPFDVMPWTSGNVSAGLNPDGTETTLAFAEFSTSRLAPANGMHLLITAKNADADADRTVIDIPLVNYLLLYKSEKYASMPAQEYLDREDSWEMIFFLDSEKNWLKTHIVVNDWVVRLNNIDY